MSTMMAIIDPGDEVDRLRAVLRELRPRRDPLGRDAALRHAARAGLVVRSRRARRRLQRQDEGHHPQHAEQSDRQGVQPRRARDDRGALPEVGRDRDLRRNLRAHHLRRPRARADRHDRGHGRAHRHDQRAVEDLQRDRLAGGLDDFAARRSRARSARSTTFSPSARRRRCRRRARSRSACPTSTTRTWPRTTGGGATCCSTSSSGITSPATSRYGAYYIMTDIGAFGFPTMSSSRAIWSRTSGWPRCPGSSFYKDPAKGRTKLRFCYCKRDETLAEADRRLDEARAGRDAVTLDGLRRPSEAPSAVVESVKYAKRILAGPLFLVPRAWSVPGPLVRAWSRVLGDSGTRTMNHGPSTDREQGTKNRGLSATRN